jgi:Xaa-Pro dipeptidase
MMALLGDVERLRAVTARCDVVVLTQPASVLHFTGFPLNAYSREGSAPWSWSPAALVISPSDEVLVVVAHHLAAATETMPADQIRTYDALDSAGFDGAVVKAVGRKPRCMGVEGRSFNASLLGALGKPEYVQIDDDVARLCAVKEKWEIDKVRSACAVSGVGQRRVADAFRLGVSELGLFHAARQSMETAIGGRVVLAGELASGSPAARNQGGDPSERRVAAGETVICDLAPAVAGFFGDSCSTLVLGDHPAAIEAVEVAMRALDAAAASLQPGKRGTDVDEAGRAVLRRRGYSCPHHLGHGLGLAQLEYPLIAPGSEDRLEAGQIVALEPAVYRDGFAVRVEHVFALGADGPERLTSHELVVTKGVK